MPKISSHQITIGGFNYEYAVYYASSKGGFYLRANKKDEEGNTAIDILEGLDSSFDADRDVFDSEAKAKRRVLDIKKAAEDDDYTDRMLTLIRLNAPRRIILSLARRLDPDKTNGIHDILSPRNSWSDASLQIEAINFCERRFNKTGRTEYHRVYRSDEGEYLVSREARSYPGNVHWPEKDLIIDLNPALNEAIDEFWRLHDKMSEKILEMIITDDGRAKLALAGAHRLLNTSGNEE